MRISDWMSDVCSSDLRGSASAAAADRGNGVPAGSVPAAEYRRVARAAAARAAETHSDGNIGPRGIDRPPPARAGFDWWSPAPAHRAQWRGANQSARLHAPATPAAVSPAAKDPVR